MAPNRSQGECPNCHRKFDSAATVIRHLNHPYMSCTKWLLPLDSQPNPPSSPVQGDPKDPPHVAFPFSGHVFGRDQGFADRFHRDKFAEHRAENLYFPFGSRDEFELGAFLTQNNLSMKVIDRFLSLALVCRCSSFPCPPFMIKPPGAKTWSLFPECKGSPSPCRASPQWTQVGVTGGQNPWLFHKGPVRGKNTPAYLFGL